MQKSRIIHYDFSLAPDALFLRLIPFFSQIPTFKCSPKKMISSIIHTLAWKHFFAFLGYPNLWNKISEYVWKHCENAGKPYVVVVVVYFSRGKMPKQKRNLWKIVIFLSHCSMKAEWIDKKWIVANEWIFLQISDWMLLRDFFSIVEEKVND